MKKKLIRRTDDEWMILINECRASGCSDKIWCQEHNIPTSSFYNHIKKLQTKACTIPAPTRDSVSKPPEIVQIDFNAPADHASQSVPLVSSCCGQAFL